MPNSTIVTKKSPRARVDSPNREKEKKNKETQAYMQITLNSQSR